MIDYCFYAAEALKALIPNAEFRIGKNYSIHTNLPYAEPVLTGNNMPKSWNDRWRSAENKYQKNYIPIQVAKDIQGMIRVNAMRIGKTS